MREALKYIIQNRNKHIQILVVVVVDCQNNSWIEKPILCQNPNFRWNENFSYSVIIIFDDFETVFCLWKVVLGKINRCMSKYPIFSTDRICFRRTARTYPESDTNVIDAQQRITGVTVSKLIFWDWKTMRIYRLYFVTCKLYLPARHMYVWHVST